MPDKSSIINWANEFAQIIYHKNRATLKSMLLFNKQALNNCLIDWRKPEVPTPTPLEPYAFKARPARLSGSTSNYIIAVGWGPDPQSGVNRPKSFREIPGTPVRLTHYLAESRVLETHAFHRTIPLPTDDNSSLLDSPEYILILKSFLSLSMMSIWLLTAFSAAIDFIASRGGSRSTRNSPVIHEPFA